MHRPTGMPAPSEAPSASPRLMNECCSPRTLSPRPRHVSATCTCANLRNQYVPAGNTTGRPSRQRSRALVYAATNARLRSTASIRAHLLRVATRGRRFRRSSWLSENEPRLGLPTNLGYLQKLSRLARRVGPLRTDYRRANRGVRSGREVPGRPPRRRGYRPPPGGYRHGNLESPAGRAAARRGRRQFIART